MTPNEQQPGTLKFVLLFVSVILLVWLALVGKAQSPATPVGVLVQMSDGTQQVYPLANWLRFSAGKLTTVTPAVNIVATRQPDGSWKYSKPGGYVQVWRNGVLQRRDVDYTLDQAAARIVPAAAFPDWLASDYVTVAYLY